MRFKGLDLNLLVAFDVLMETRSVSRAAERLNFSQPALSASLARLRQYFNDELLVSHGKRMHPTPFAEAVASHVKDALRSVDTVLSTPASFDPATSHRVFRIVASDYVIMSLLCRVVTALAITAPGVRIDMSVPEPDAIEQLDQGKVDLMISPSYAVASDHPSEPLYEDELLVVGWSQNPVMINGPSEDEFFAAGHVTVALGANKIPAFADKQLELQGRKRRIETTAPFFAAVPWLLENTMRLAILQKRLVDTLLPRFPIAASPVPFEMASMEQLIFFHRVRQHDAGLAWLRQVIRTHACI
jgi:LysR family transcriptional regulator, nod-box dependent transcriptional activator